MSKVVVMRIRTSTKSEVSRSRRLKGNPPTYPMEVEQTARLLEKLEPKSTARIRRDVVRDVNLRARHTWVKPKCHSDNNIETFSLADHQRERSETENGTYKQGSRLPASLNDHLRQHIPSC